ncbi:hypothetical protein N8S98_11950 [Enterobacter hormaechei subsp. steigerwaltii]|uniref:hypothetical protein n=1 Tax=Enterobacter hormaechei TaxID=158836 RepID=UPI0012602240|nr:hypothetical protein [Enterobacter hormaechei]MCU2440096.1 hypothetical protein [Enterobacter hormaechei subsp. steigerwaltii]DAL27356.1 MAG TPA_asm: hypothetical protein [Caudoviricetes sp.]MCU3118398.1 hypothetical protein [Enterobacter hormaechei subsp. steigerwaltii]MCU3168781.1 hypothetical protein [Enterobacter hormaechei subsp. steigerwaltii]MCU3255681.1 hypothetical protein [Enterobacter hormaechei subsp. steigerwaltii]
MLDGYSVKTTADRDRLIAVQAALEIAKAAVGATGAGTQSKVSPDLKAVANGIGELADAIQAALTKK